MASWEKMWSRGLPKGAAFDCGEASRALMSWMGKISSRVAPNGVLVAGCGRAYDAIELARAMAPNGVLVTALDVAPTACEAARALIAEEADREVASRVEVVEGDFFAHERTYDLAWDCTFCCALPLELREPWAEGYSRMIAPGGMLVCLVFPIVPAGHPMERSGPPFPMSVAAVRALLEPKGFTVVEVRDPLPQDEKHRPGGTPSGPTSPGSALVAFVRDA